MRGAGKSRRRDGKKSEKISDGMLAGKETVIKMKASDKARGNNPCAGLPGDTDNMITQNAEEIKGFFAAEHFSRRSPCNPAEKSIKYNQ